MYFVQFAMILLVTTVLSAFQYTLKLIVWNKTIAYCVTQCALSFQVNEGVAMDTYMIKDPYKNDMFTDRNNAIIYLNYL